MKLLQLGIVYTSLCAVIAMVACSGEDANESEGARPQASTGANVVEKALDAGGGTSDAAP